MRKLILIALKDIKLIFRDPPALLMMLAAPFALTLGLGFVTGQFGGSASGIGNIPVALVDQDGGQLGGALVELFQSEELSELVTVTLFDEPAEAYRQVDGDLFAAAVVVSAGFTDSIIPPAGATLPGPEVQIQVYGNPTRPTGVGVVKTILEEFVSRLEVARAAGTVTVTQLVAGGLVPPEQAAALAAAAGERQAGASGEGTVTLVSNVSEAAGVTFNPLAYIAPGMALMFLMFTASNAGRTLLVERDHGTLPRLLVSPTASAQVLAGKIFGVYLTGAAQMLILILASTLFFGLQWGDPLAVLALVLAAVFGATGWGLLITALARRPGQVAAIGSALMLIFGILGGSFVDLELMPAWVQAVSKITPNAWGLDGFTTLALGGGLELIGAPLLALAVMGLALFGAALLFFNRRGMAQK
jgi:ABC-2 type transport system permease protein